MNENTRYKPNQAHYVVVTCIIVKSGKYLITKRALHEKAYPGVWTVPGGKLELDDYTRLPKDTSDHWYNVCENLLRREVKEETGLEIDNIDYLTSLAFIRPDNVPVVILSFYADHAAGEVRLSSDMTEYAWVTLEEAKNYELIEGIYEEMDMLDRKLEGQLVKQWQKN